VFCNVQWPDRAQARLAAQGPLEIVICTQCGHAHNAAFDPKLVAYSPAYDNSQHFSTTFREYAAGLVDRLVETYDIRERAVVDIGCGRGDLLAMLSARGSNRGFGFDPSFDSTSTAASGPDITISREFFGREHAAAIKPALVCCRHVLEHIFEPLQFLEDLRHSLAAAGTPLLYLEVPSGDQLLRSAGLWDYIYEHYSYFSRQSLEFALNAAGFEVLRIHEDFGGQFLCVEARPCTRVVSSAHQVGCNPQASQLDSAAQRMRIKLGEWQAWADALVGTGSNTATLWGAGSKGVMFVNLLGLSAPDPVDFVIDQNPGKSGRYLAVSGQVVMPPAYLLEKPAGEIIVMNGIYLEEIRASLENIGSRARIAAA
jgi:SAM-dependent methyltransferase